MRFTAADVPANGNFAGLDLDAVLFQDWKDQTVIAFGGAYQVSDPLVLRAGLNFAKDPIPDALLNALFPAIVENHITFGAGYEFLENQNFDLSATIGLTKEATNPGFGTPGEPGYVPPVTSKIDGVWQLVSQIQLSFLSWLPVHESTPFLRVLTGAAFGWFTAWFGYPTIEETVRDEGLRLEAKAAIERQTR